MAEFLLEHCGQEEDFIRRGGCLMDRVRLSLLLAKGMRLSVSEIAALTGDNITDVKRKTRQNDGSWVKTEEIEVG